MRLQTSMSSPGIEPSPYDTAVSVANHYTGWVPKRHSPPLRCFFDKRGLLEPTGFSNNLSCFRLSTLSINTCSLISSTFGLNYMCKVSQKWRPNSAHLDSSLGIHKKIPKELYLYDV
ncbi:hypothetical protein TNCV_2805621 [Trichonephila clavipes]|nr:hypothetical protein TNCV_2805621 [Trichonephila clavipes]